MTARARGTGNYEDFTSEYNALSFIITKLINYTVNTCYAVTVTDVDTDNLKVTVKPLISQRDGENKKIDLPDIFSIPYFRLGAGKTAIKIDPVPGDIGILIVFKSDSNNIKIGDNSTILPATDINYPLYSGVYFVGILMNEPENYLELNGDDITINVKGDITVNCSSAAVNADEDVEINCKNAAINADGDVEAECANATIKADNKVSVDAQQISFCGATAATGAVGVGSPCPLTGSHVKGSSKVFINGGA